MGEVGPPARGGMHAWIRQSKKSGAPPARDPRICSSDLVFASGIHGYSRIFASDLALVSGI